MCCLPMVLAEPVVVVVVVVVAVAVLVVLLRYAMRGAASRGDVRYGMIRANQKTNEWMDR